MVTLESINYHFTLEYNFYVSIKLGITKTDQNVPLGTLTLAYGASKCKHILFWVDFIV